MGTPFADGRGHVLLSGEVVNSKGIYGVPRNWNNRGWYIVQNPAYVPGNGQPDYLVTPNAGPQLMMPGGLAMGLLNVLLVFVGVAAVVFFATQGLAVMAVVAAVVGVLAVLSLALVHAALSGIYSAALYRFAMQGDAAAGFDGMLLREAFLRKL